MTNHGLNSILKEFAKLPMTRGVYNPFAAWGMSENDHTKLLVAILRYNDAQGKCPVLRSFLFRLTGVDFENLENVKVKFNHGCVVESGFIDGLITFTHDAQDYAIVIENKIYDAPDQKDQIRRYIREAKNILRTDKETVLDRIWVFYITRDGSKVVDDTSYNIENEKIETYIDGRFVSISYKNHIISWLKDEVLGNTNYPKSLTDVAKVYLEHLESELINNSYMSEKKTWLLEQMGIAAELREISKPQLVELYNLRKEIQDYRKTKKRLIDQESLNSINVILSDILRDLEDLAFDEFERQTKIILDEWSKDKGLDWKVAHRGVRDGSKGYLQIRLVEDWGTVHMEWIPIGVADMLCSDKQTGYESYKYYLELHIEGNAKELKQSIVNELKDTAPTIGLLRSRSRICRLEVVKAKPFAQMSEQELRDSLHKCYIKDAACLFNLVADYGDKYKKRSTL